MISPLRFCYASDVSKEAFFDTNIRQRALLEFFGKLRGNYLYQNEPLKNQLYDLLEIDFSAEGKSIARMPSLGSQLFLDIGSQYESPNELDTGAVIIDLSGHIKAAAMYWQPCWSPSLCGVGPMTLTIFVRGFDNIGTYKNVFTSLVFVLNGNHKDGGMQIRNEVFHAKDWIAHPISVDKADIVFLHGYEDQSVN